MPFMLDVIIRRNHERHSLRCERGQALVEFALVLPLLLLVVLGIAEFGRALGYKDDMTHLANAASRYAAVNNSPNGNGTLADYVKSTAPQGLRNLLNDPSANFTFTFPDNTDPNHCVGDPVTVTIQIHFPWIGGNFLAVHHAIPISLDSTITSTSTMRLEKEWNSTVPANNAYTSPIHLLAANPC